MKNSKPIALEAYESLAERYSNLAEEKAENGYFELPAIRKQIGTVSDLNVLDAGCGPGFLSLYLLNNGANVTGFDISPKMVELAKMRAEGRGVFHVADMAQPLRFIENEKFDLVVSSLAIDYVKEWNVPLKEFWRALKPNGRFVFTVQHPLGAYLWYNPPSAFGVHYVEATWSGFGGEPVVVPDYYRSFEEIINPLIENAFSIKKIFDTRPLESLKDKNPQRFDKYNKIPTFMCIEAQKSN